MGDSEVRGLIVSRAGWPKIVILGSVLHEKPSLDVIDSWAPCTPVKKHVNH